ncbi:MAG: N-acetyl-gamma-glutamyl-phosphate reductase [Desulfobacterales bacterium]|nr:N-acetyl-gamma-glutamyl-phosphate reductase [Desulfobacterales bacterium]
MTRVAVVGATGYAGAELVRILSVHPEVEITIITSRQYAGTRFAAVYPGMETITELVCEPFEIETLCQRADLVFLALPHELPMAIVPELLAAGLRVVDLSADFRFRSRERYETAYQPHKAPHLLESAVYGLTEIYRAQIAAADLVGNPGCYPTTVLLPLVPLLREGLVDGAGLVADAKSGVSGAGRSPGLTSHFCEVNESYKPYKVAAHRHNPEMDEVLSEAAAQAVHITFVPHLVPMTRGMLTTIYAQPQSSVSETTIWDCLRSCYDQAPFIRLCTDHRIPDTRFVKGTNFCDIGLRMDAANNRLVLIAAIDNLVKGAAGQAVQNMNVMLGVDEKCGLMPTPYPL